MAEPRDNPNAIILETTLYPKNEANRKGYHIGDYQIALKAFGGLPYSYWDQVDFMLNQLFKGANLESIADDEKRAEEAKKIYSNSKETYIFEPIKPIKTGGSGKTRSKGKTKNRRKTIRN